MLNVKQFLRETFSFSIVEINEMFDKVQLLKKLKFSFSVLTALKEVFFIRFFKIIKILLIKYKFALKKLNISSIFYINQYEPNLLFR